MAKTTLHEQLEMVHAKLEELDIDAQERSKTNVLNDNVFSSLCAL